MNGQESCPPREGLDAFKLNIKSRELCLFSLAWVYDARTVPLTDGPKDLSVSGSFVSAASVRPRCCDGCLSPGVSAVNFEMGRGESRWKRCPFPPLLECKEVLNPTGRSDRKLTQNQGAQPGSAHCLNTLRSSNHCTNTCYVYMAAYLGCFCHSPSTFCHLLMSVGGRGGRGMDHCGPPEHNIVIILTG